jgi:tetratricopeptide (TPR) repeat protein
MRATFTAEDEYRRGRELLDGGRYSEALECFRSAHRLDPRSAVYRSFLGVAIAASERRFHHALELCRSAAKEEFFNPELYHNLARVHIAFGFKSEAIRYLRRGLMIDPGHVALNEALARLGRRRRPVLDFLPRRHPVNRVLGRLRRRFEPQTA